MKYLILFFLGSMLSLHAQNIVEDYPIDSASLENPRVPRGEVLKFTFENSKIFPGTWREYWVYVPAQYDPQKPACVYINQDGVQWKAPTVFDNLIHSKEMPVTIGVFVMHGKVNAPNPETAQDRYNRSFEYDGLGDAYARFLLEELLPEVERKQTSDGRAIRLSTSGNDRAIGGSSSGAVCAFTAAWERPDAFSRVFSAIGTYVGLRGADRYPTLVRKYEPKPLRIYLQDGENDLNIYAGDWWMANQLMQRALTFSGYEVTHSWGQGGHNGKHGTAIFPDAMRYLWRDWPTPVKVGISKNQMLTEIVSSESGWETVGAVQSGLADMKVNAAGEVFVQAKTGIVKINNEGRQSSLSKLPPLPAGPKLAGISGLKAGGTSVSPDHTQLYATDATSHWVVAFQVLPDGSLTHKQQYGWLHVADDADQAEAGGIACDQEGRVYVATRLGVQVLDQPGRVNAILPVPQGKALDVAFGGTDFSYLYVLTDQGIFRRKVKVRGATEFDPPIKTAKPRL